MRLAASGSTPQPHKPISLQSTSGCTDSSLARPRAVLSTKTITEALLINSIARLDNVPGLPVGSFALYIKTKNFHWHVSGRHFRDYHLLLDEQATQILASTDLIAERVRKIGGNTIRSVGHIARLSEVRDNDADHVPAKDMLGELRQDNLILVDSLKKAKAIADTAGDNASSGVIDGWTDEAEQRAWFLLESARD